MNNKVIPFLTFVLGAAAGSFVTCHYLKDVYEQIAQEEIDSVKEVFLKRERELSEDEEPKRKIAACYENGESKAVVDKKEIAEYAERIQKEGYTNYSDVASGKKEMKKAESKPYVISPEEFGEFEEYEKISLTYYSNNILADENNEVIEDVEETIGVDSLTHFGEYEDDSVFVRNDARKCDYEILLDQRSYAEVVKQMPHRVEEE